MVAYDEVAGYALVSGGQPTILGEDGGCQTGTYINNSRGLLWIFSRIPEANEVLVESIRKLTFDAGFGNDVVYAEELFNQDGERISFGSIKEQLQSSSKKVEK